MISLVISSVFKMVLVRKGVPLINYRQCVQWVSHCTADDSLPRLALVSSSWIFELRSIKYPEFKLPLLCPEYNAPHLGELIQ
jgi:hypothetical protein